MYTSLHEVTKEILESLTPREAKVLRMRFGIDMNTDHTLEEVGKQFDVTRERIRQIEAKSPAQAAPPNSQRPPPQLPRQRRKQIVKANRRLKDLRFFYWNTKRPSEKPNLKRFNGFRRP